VQNLGDPVLDRKSLEVLSTVSQYKIFDKNENTHGDNLNPDDTDGDGKGLDDSGEDGTPDFRDTDSVTIT
jgi:hypothetical protein